MEKETRSLLGWEEKLERISAIDSRIRKLKDQVKDLEKLKAPLEKDVKKALEDFDQGVAQGYIVSYNRATTHRFDSKALQADLPEVFAKYYKVVPSRKFLIKPTETLAVDEFNF